MIDGDTFSGMNLPGVLEDYTVLEEFGFLFLLVRGRSEWSSNGGCW